MSDCECNKTLINILILKIVHKKKHLFGKLVLACEDEIINTTETSLVDKRVAWKELFSYLNYFVFNYMLIIVVISISCYYYYRKHWIKKEWHRLICIKWIV